MDLFGRPGTLIGMVHLAPLPGSPRYAGDMGSVHRAALRDAATLVEAGFDAILVENFGDVPFHPDRVPAITIGAMAAVLEGLRRELPEALLGVNVLRNDARAALAIAAATGASFIRVNVHCGATVTDQGLLTGQAHRTLRARAALGAKTAILADVSVKHGRSLAPLSLEEEVGDLVERGLADGLLVTGPRTGTTASLTELKEVLFLAQGTPVLVASGVTAKNAVDYLTAGARGLIVGTSIKRFARTGEAVDPVEAQELAQRVKNWAGSARSAARTRRKT